MLLVLVFAILWAAAVAVPNVTMDDDMDIMPLNTERYIHRRAVIPGDISFHGDVNALMTVPMQVHFILYGTRWPTGSAALITQVVNGLGSSNWWRINAQYCNAYSCSSPAGKQFVTSTISVGTVLTDNYSYGTALTENDIMYIVAEHQQANRVRTNTNDIYFVLTDRTVSVGGSAFCGTYCGWHSAFSYNAQPSVYYKFAFTGSPLHCSTPTSSTGNACSALGSAQAPNSIWEVDSAFSVIMHEIAETASDWGNGWYDAAGYENADKCVWTFGTLSTAGSLVWNEDMGGRHVLVQRNWALSPSQGCYGGSQFAGPTRSASKSPSRGLYSRSRSKSRSTKCKKTVSVVSPSGAALADLALTNKSLSVTGMYARFATSSGNLRVTFKLSGNVNQYTARLITPQGVPLALCDRRCKSTNTFSFTRPAMPSPNGAWVLSIRDNVRARTASLTAFSLAITSSHCVGV